MSSPSPLLMSMSEDTIIFCLETESLLVALFAAYTLSPISSQNDFKNKNTYWILSA